MHHRTYRRMRICVLVATLFLFALPPAYGQKKKNDPTPSPSAVQSTTGDVPLHYGSKQGATIHEVLVKILGQHTNIGRLTKVTSDYLMFENDGDTLVYPINVVQSVKFMKVEEGEPRKIEIKFLIKD